MAITNKSSLMVYGASDAEDYCAYRMKIGIDKLEEWLKQQNPLPPPEVAFQKLFEFLMESLMNSPQAQCESECAPDFDSYLDSAEYQKWLDEVNSQQQDYGRIEDDGRNG